MKLLHCADLHLDSKMSANLDRKRARERRWELLHTYERMIAYAREQQIPYLLIAGDLFDTAHISATTRNAVRGSILQNPQITFFLLRGNHDRGSFLEEWEELPDNLKLFGTQWTRYVLGEGRVILTGRDWTESIPETAYHELILDPGQFHIVTLHGQIAESGGAAAGEEISLKGLRSRNIDYLALGHVHAFREGRLDGRGIYCYPGCLEGRGFDECGEHGFVVLDIDETTGAYTREWVPFAARNLYTVEVDVTGCTTSAQMSQRIDEALQAAGHSSRSLLKIVLTGEVDVTGEKDPDYLAARIQDRYYFVKIYDGTTYRLPMEEYLREESLKGEFVRTVMKREDLTEEDRMAVIRCGLQALAGEEIRDA